MDNIIKEATFSNNSAREMESGLLGGKNAEQAVLEFSGSPVARD